MRAFAEALAWITLIAAIFATCEGEKLIRAYKEPCACSEVE
jgi:hypothetical protein